MSPVIPVVLCVALVQAHLSLSLQMFLCPLVIYPQGDAFFWAADTGPMCTPVIVVVPYHHPPPTPAHQKLHILARKSPPGHFAAAASMTLSL